MGEIERKARAGGPVTVALLEESDEDDGDVRVKPYSAAAAEEQIRSGQRADTSRVAIMLRTPVQPSDTLATAEARLDAFVRNVAKPGRVALDTGDPELTIVNPGQYRAAIVAAVAVDAKKVLVELGPGHGARIEGLENRIAWRRASDLELMLYISHRLTIEPARGP